MWKKLPCYSRDASASCSKSVQLTDCCSKELPCKLQFVSIASTTRPPRVARGDRTHLRPRILWPTQTVDRTGELHRYGLRWTVTSWAFTEKVNAIGWRQSQLGHPRRAVGLLVGLHRITAARVSSSATVTSTVLHWVPCGLSRYTATADGLYSATADSPATAPGPRVVRTPSPCAVPPTRFSPANRAPNRRRTIAKTVAVVPVSPICPVSSTSTRSAWVSTGGRG